MDRGIIVYHGSNESVPVAQVSVGRDNLDFGKGFYVTDILPQAAEWAKRRSARRGGKPVLNTYMLDRDAASRHYKCKVFQAYDAEWLQFIVASRRGGKPWAGYDLIEGGVADDRVVDTVDLYMMDFITAEMAIDRLIRFTPNNQICILNQEIIDRHLTFLKSETL